MTEPVLQPRLHVPKVLAIGATIGVVSRLHYVTDPSHVLLHEVYQYLCYGPIIFAAYWYGAWGGLAAAFLASAGLVPHIRGAWATNAPYMASQYAQVVVFHLLGISVGLLASSQRQLTERYRSAAVSYQRAHRELQESQAHLRRADRLSALGEVAAGLAHEIRNPLASVKGSLEIIASRLPGSTPEAEFAQIAGKELARLEGLLTDFLTYARPHDPELRVAVLRQVVERVVRLLQPEAERARVTVDIQETGRVAPFRMDPQQMEQVVFNVALNAIQASPPDGRVRIRESLDGTHAVLEVVDEGCGIAPEHQPRIFDPFFTTKHRGTGLGLAISQRIVAGHRGTLDVISSAPRGTTVRIRLPLSVGSTGAVSSAAGGSL